MLTRRNFSTLACALAGCFGAQAQVTVNDAIIVSEFFDEFEFVDPSIPLTTPMYQSPSNGGDVSGKPTHLLLESSGTLLYSTGGSLRRFDPATGIKTPVTGPFGTSIESLAMEADGTVLAVAGDDIFRINPAHGQATTLPQEEPTFYSPSLITVAPNGSIYVKEFFDKILRLDPVTLQFSQVPGADAWGGTAVFEALPSGEIAVMDSDRNLHLFDPTTGLSTPVGFNPGETAVFGTSVTDTGKLLMTTSDQVFEINLQTGVGFSLAPDISFFSPKDVVKGSMQILFDTDRDGDFDDSDLGTAFSFYTGPVGAAGGMTYRQGDIDNDGDVDDSDLGTFFSGYTGPINVNVNVPEPTSLVLLGLGGLMVAARRRRHAAY